MGKRGLLLGGGASRGAFQAGVVCALDRAGVRFDTIVGTSVGAANGAAILHGYGPDLCDMWAENLRAVRWVDPWLVLRGRSPFLISEAMRLMVSRYGDFDRARRGPTELLVSTTEWATGRNRLFSSREEGWTDEEHILQFLASLTIPVICTEKIVIRGTRYCDGGLSDNFPLHALLERGCTEVVVVDPSPGSESMIVRAAAPLARPLARLPLSAAKLAAGYLTAAMTDAPKPRDGVTLRVVAPERPLSFSGLEFRNHAAIRQALDLGLAAGEKVAREMARDAEAAAVAAA